jgi:hypothetical protein
MHPFSDDSALPTFFLVSKIQNESKRNKTILLDGLGTDGCFSVSNESSYFKRLIYMQPKRFLQLEAL